MNEDVIVTEVEPQRGTPSGGPHLRALREARGLTQLAVELAANLGTGYLQRVESGRVGLPTRMTVLRILDALRADYGEARAILAAYGYTETTALPTPREGEWAASAVHGELERAPYPGYALDCAARLVAWNRYLPAVMGLAPGEPLPSDMRRRSLLFAWFDATTPLGALIADPDELHPALARALRYEVRRFPRESWVAELIAELETLPRFRQVWATVRDTRVTTGAARARTPLRLRLRSGAVLTFWLSAEPFAADPRFRAIFWFPADQATIAWCAGSR